MNLKKYTHAITAVCVLGSLAVAGIAGKDFYDFRHYEEVIIPGEGVTSTFQLSDYNENLKGTFGDTTVYVMEGEKEGGSFLVLGGTHPNEPSGHMAAITMIESGKVEAGTVYVIPRTDNSAFTHNDAQEASPHFFHIETESGTREFVFGSRASNPIDQWPDPDVYTHQSGQTLSGSEMRNINRTYPGVKDGTLTEQIVDGQGQYFGASGDRELCLENLNALDDNSFYLAYVTLDKIMPYEAFLEFAEAQSDSIMDVWCAPRTMAGGAYQAAGRPANLGFYTSLGQSSSVEWDREKYPDLVIWSYGDDPASREDAGEKIADEASAGEHFAVMLDYMAEQEKFLEMMGQSADGFAEAADYVRENGLEIYGFACIAQKDVLLELMETDEVYGIYTVEYN